MSERGLRAKGTSPGFAGSTRGTIHLNYREKLFFDPLVFNGAGEGRLLAM
jgi:hypothetical protein